MSLSEYKKKRDFSATPEPAGKEKIKGKRLRFVVQQHDASTLHYDFRLELEGVLKSWAIPKGPSLSTKDKRLAVMVEDHPYSYRNFEGVIPEGNYGGGTVIIWDEGFYEPANADSEDIREQEKNLLRQLQSGSIKFTLHGSKLNGLYTLFRLKKGGHDAWLLVKNKDEYATDEEVTLLNKSVKSKRTIAEIASENGVSAKSEKEAKTISKKENTAPTQTKGFKKVEENTPQKRKAITDLSSTKKKTKSTITINRNENEEQALKLNSHIITITHSNKPYWKNEGILKGDVINYYLKVAPFILPYLKDRAQSLHRYPNGVGEKGFFQKDVAGKVPHWIPTFADFSESTDELVHYLVCKNEAVLIYMANMGCIEMHPWLSRTKHPQHPDFCLIDLDPDKSNSYDQVVETALVAKQLLDSAGVDCYAKTSGATGMHLCIPLGAKYSFDESLSLAELIVNGIYNELPKLTSIERSPAKRKGKIYLDYLQNAQTKTVVAPYSLRPKPCAPISAPLYWSEVKKGLDPHNFTIKNIHDRLKSEGDLFKPVIGKGINLKKAISKINSIIS